MDNAAPGWYRDPARADDAYRWWTGSQWTDLLTDDPDVGPPPKDVAMRTVDPNPAGRRRRRWVATGVTAAVLLLLLIGMGVAGSRANARHHVPRTAVPTGPASTAAPPWALGSDRSLRFGTVATGVMPGAPWDEPSKPRSVYGLFMKASMTSFEIHPETERTSAWYATVASGWVKSDLGAPTPKGTAVNMLGPIQESWYSSVDHLGTKDVHVSEIPGLSSDQAVKVSLKATYDVAGIPSRYDQIELVVIKVDVVNYAAWISAIPNDAPQAVKKAATRAEDSIAKA